ncbi:MAG: chromosome segregation ATPase [Solirubrobacterales bacterium]|nr:chromosome segregation ATPase [Solirubrobacterales bacterium]
MLGARKHARTLADEVRRLRSELERLGALDLAEIERRRDAVACEVAEQEARLAREREETSAALADERKQVEAQIAGAKQEASEEQARAASELAQLRAQVVVTTEEALLQEAGIYEYRHPLTDSVAYKAELERLRDAIKTMARKDGGAILAVTNWTVNGSATQGRAMVRDFSKLMLRAYNAEADNLVRGLKPYKLASAIDRLTKVTATIERLGRTMDIRVSTAYHALRVRELELTADYVEKLALEKEREREERERLREDRQARQEMERERARLEKERQHFENALQTLVASTDEDGAARLREQLADVERAIEDVDYRAANIRAGYVYVISNLGSFGERMVKIGMTRRLDPFERVRELGDASVPFRYDVHALFFSDDAVGIETQLHERLANCRVNRVNQRREFFYATPAEVKAHLLELAGELLQYEELAEALEYRQSAPQPSSPSSSSYKGQPEPTTL